MTVIEPYGKDCLRCRSTRNARISEENWTLLPPGEDACVIEGDEKFVTITNGMISATLEAGNQWYGGVVSYYRKGEQILRTRFEGDYVNKNVHVEGDHYQVKVIFDANEGEHFYGLGQETGITIMQMDPGIDTGDILYQKKISVMPEDNYETLHDRLMKLGGTAVTEALELLEQGRLHPEKQQEEQSCYAPLIRKEMGRIDFSEGAEAIDRRIRAMTPWPSAYTFYHGKQLKIWKAVPEAACGACPGKPGEILRVDADSVTAAAGEGTLRILELQLEGRKRMTARDFLRGVRMQPGEVLGADMEGKE